MSVITMFDHGAIERTPEEEAFLEVLGFAQAAIFRAAVTIEHKPDQFVIWVPWGITSRPKATQAQWKGFVIDIIVAPKPTLERPQGKTTFLIRKNAPGAFLTEVTEFLHMMRPTMDDAGRGEIAWEPRNEISHPRVQAALAIWRMLAGSTPFRRQNERVIFSPRHAINSRANELRALINIDILDDNTLVMSAPWICPQMMDEVAALFAEWHGLITSKQCRIEFNPEGTRIIIVPDFPDFSEFTKEIHDILARAGALSWEV